MNRRLDGTRSDLRHRPAAKTALTALALCAAAGLVPGGTSAQTAADSAALLARIDDYAAVWNGHDAAALSAFFTDSADLVMGNQPEAVGRQAIRGSWRDYFSHQEPERHLTLDVHSTRFVDGDVAVVNVTTTTGGSDREGRALVSRRFRGAWVVQRQHGEWLIAAMRGEPMEEDRVVLNESPPVVDALRPRIRAFVDAYEEAFNRHVPSAVSDFYGDDADIIVRNGPLTHGRQAIRDWWQSYFAQARRYRAVYVVKSIRSVTSDVALVDLIVAGAPLEPAAPPLPARYTRATWLLAREGPDAGWLIEAVWVLPSEDDDIIRAGGSRDAAPGLGEDVGTQPRRRAGGGERG